MDKKTARGGDLRQLVWLVSFMQYDLRYVDLEEKTLQPLEKSLRAKSVTNVLAGCEKR
jgi:hypothetical protein